MAIHGFCGANAEGGFTRRRQVNSVYREKYLSEIYFKVECSVEGNVGPGLFKSQGEKSLGDVGIMGCGPQGGTRASPLAPDTRLNTLTRELDRSGVTAIRA